MKKVFIIGNIAFSAMHIAELAMTKHQIEIVCQNSPSEKEMPNRDCFASEPFVIKRLVIPQLQQDQFRDKKGKLFEPMKSKYHK
ncbi:MAG: hypothetical protein V4683_19150 [Bacteroidota bacterium]